MARPTTVLEDTRMAEVLHVAIDLGGSSWKLVSGAPGARPRCRSVPAGDIEAVMAELAAAKKRLSLPQSAEVYSCYEAGRDGFWLHRVLVARGVRNVVIDAASCEVSRRAKRSKTDRIDGENMLDLLMRYNRGADRNPLRVVNVPSVEVEDERRPNRERDRLIKERTQHRARIKDLLAKYGIKKIRLGRLAQDLDSLRGPDQTEIPSHTRVEVRRELQRLELVVAQIKEVEAERRELLEANEAQRRQVEILSALCGVAEQTAFVLVYEFFRWRKFRNRREVGALAGLVSVPYKSDGMSREQGISKAGNRRVRTLMIQLAWRWTRYQPRSRLTKWYNERFAGGNGRSRKVGITALARRLLIDLWRLVEHGVVPDGAVLKLT